MDLQWELSSRKNDFSLLMFLANEHFLEDSLADIYPLSFYQEKDSGKPVDLIVIYIPMKETRSDCQLNAINFSTTYRPEATGNNVTTDDMIDLSAQHQTEKSSKHI